MKVIKRSLEAVEFDCNKIRIAVQKAMDEVGNKDELLSNAVASGVTNKILQKELKEITVENIQDIVEETLLQFGMVDVARAYIRYRYLREMDRKTKERNETIFGLVNSSASDELYKENSNKDARVVNTMRDYIAGETCKTLASEYYPKDILEAHKNGLIHLHDMDYSPVMPLHNCELINLEDMLQNGTVINGKLIEKPHSFRTACTIATQVVAGVTSSSYGGATINLAHLVPFVNESRKSITKRFNEYFPNMEDKELNEAIEKEVAKEIRDSIQTIQYQLNTLNTTNGQAPFISIFMYIDEVEGQEREDMVKCISEILKQRIEGIKNPQGHPVTVAFPKLLYVLDEDNDHEGSEYWELTRLAAECTAKRLVPDYISAKKMRELKEGNVFGCMGCRSFLQPYYENGKPKFWGRLALL